MATFRARDRSTAVLRSPRSEVWAALTDAALIAKITPYVTSIDVEGDRWTWRMGTIPVLGLSVAPKFTEVMDLQPQDRIVCNLPLPGLARPAVERVMAGVVKHMGTVFSRNLLKHLGEA